MSKKKNKKKIKIEADVIESKEVVDSSQEELSLDINSQEDTTLLQKVNFSLKEGINFLEDEKNDFTESELAEEVTDEATAFESDLEEDVELSADNDSSNSEDNLETTSEVEESDATNSESVETFVEQDQLLSIIESVLFVSDKPVSMSQLKGIFVGTNIGLKDLKKGLEKLQSSYAEVTRGFTLEEVTSGWQLRTKADNVNFLRRSVKTRPFKLGGATLEVLSIIAYKQPIVKSEVDEIRGVESGHLIRALMERGLVSFDGKSELPGKPMQYGTTRKFLEIFGLRNIKELPSLHEIDQLIPEGIGEEEEKEVLSDITDSMSESLNASYSEGEEELEKITEKLETIDTSSEFFEEEKRRQRAKRDKERAEDIRDALLMGEDVASRDKKWLERYEAGLLEEPAVVATPVKAVSSEESEELLVDSDEEESTEELSALDVEEEAEI